MKILKKTEPWLFCRPPSPGQAAQGWALSDWLLHTSRVAGSKHALHQAQRGICHLQADKLGHASYLCSLRPASTQKPFLLHYLK